MNDHGADRRCCNRPQPRDLPQTPRMKPRAYILTPPGAPTELGVPHQIDPDYWLAELDHYVRCHTNGRGLAKHVDARKIYRLLYRSSHNVPRHEHVVWKEFRFATARLMTWMNNKTHWEEGGAGGGHSSIPNFGGPEALIAVIIIGGNDGQFPHIWASEWTAMRLEHLLHEIGSFRVDPFWTKARLESEDWRRGHFVVPSTNELKSGETNFLSIYSGKDNALPRKPNGHALRSWVEEQLNHWTHLDPYQKVLKGDSVFRRREEATIEGPGGSLNHNHPPSGSSSRGREARSESLAGRTTARLGNNMNQRRQSTGVEGTTRHEMSTPNRRQVINSGASSVPAPNRRGQSQIIEQRRGNGGERLANPDNSASKRRRSPGIDALRTSPASSASPRRQGAKKSRHSTNHEQSTENDRPAGASRAVGMSRGQRSQFTPGTPVPVADMSLEPFAPSLASGTPSRAEGAAVRSARPSAVSSKLPTPAPRRAPASAANSASLRRSRSPPSHAVQAQRSNRAHEQQPRPANTTRPAALPPRARMPIRADLDSDVEEVNPDPEALRRGRKASEEKIMRGFLRHLNEYKTRDVVDLVGHLNALPASFWEQKMDAAVVRQCEADGPKRCKYKWRTHLRMIQEMFQDLKYLDGDNRLLKGSVPKINTDLVWDDDEA